MPNRFFHALGFSGWSNITRVKLTLHTCRCSAELTFTPTSNFPRKKYINHFIESDFRDAINRYRESVREVTKTSLMMLKMSLETSRAHSWVKIMNDIIKFLVRMGQSEAEKGEINP